MKEIKEYLCDGRKPTDDEIREGIIIADTENCVVKLNWFYPYSGNYDLCIIPGMSFDECQKKLPKCYPV